jgi:hypothetical protein
MTMYLGIWMALMGWTVTVVDGLPVWSHASGLVMYNQGQDKSL